MPPTPNEGTLVPIVLFPRYTTFVGATGSEFETLPVDVSPFEGARITLWRAAMQGTSSPAAKFHFDESTDRNEWTACEGTPSGGTEIGTDVEVVVAFAPRRKWFRLRVHLVGTNPAVTCYAQGLLVRRQR